jgi:hypothetical protein
MRPEVRASQVRATLVRDGLAEAISEIIVQTGIASSQCSTKIENPGKIKP